MDLVIAALQSGLASLASYLAAHVLLCLVPAFQHGAALGGRGGGAGTARPAGADE